MERTFIYIRSAENVKHMPFRTIIYMYLLNGYTLFPLPTSQLDMIYLQSSLADLYLGSTVIGFGNGSIIVDYITRFKEEQQQSTNMTTNSTTPIVVDTSVVTSAFEEGLVMSVESGAINVTIDETSIVVLGECDKMLLSFIDKLFTSIFT